MAPPSLDDRALTTRCYDGHVVRTPWNAHYRWMLSPQFMQAERHRNRVLEYLEANRLRRLRTWMGAAA
jgi:hypothetical protein